jgi:release factor glutamine methyltransferase
MRGIVLPGVFRPRSDTWLLASAACAQHVTGRILELCAGPAFAGIAVARQAGAHLTTVDVSRRATLNARVNARLNGVAIDARRGDLFEAVAGERFDLILANPPYVPGPPPPARGTARATDADADGRALLDRICAGAPAHLNPLGAVLVVHSEVCDPEATHTALERGGLDADVVAHHRGPLGPLLRTRRAQLEARGQLEPGQQFEDLMVLRGRVVGKTSETWPTLTR